MTPPEATTKICPAKLHAAVPSRVAGAEMCCHGPDCMAWRWITPEKARTVADSGYCGLATPNNPARWDAL